MSPQCTWFKVHAWAGFIYILFSSMCKLMIVLLPSGSEQHEVLLFESIWEGILQARH